MGQIDEVATEIGSKATSEAEIAATRELEWVADMRMVGIHGRVMTHSESRVGFRFAVGDEGIREWDLGVGSITVVLAQDRSGNTAKKAR